MLQIDQSVIGLYYDEEECIYVKKVELFIWFRYRPGYNVSPGSYLPVLRRESGGDEGYTAAVHCMKWGLIPSFTKKDEKPDHYRMVLLLPFHSFFG